MRIHLFTCALIALLFAGSQGFAQSDEAHVVYSRDKRLSVTLPEGWDTTQLKGSIGKIQAKSEERGGFMTLISEPREDFAGLKSIQDYADMILKIEKDKSQLQDRTMVGPKKVTINGTEAVQYELRGTIKNLKLVYLKTFIATATRYNQVMCWTSVSHWDECKGDFAAIYNTLKETAPPTTQK